MTRSPFCASNAAPTDLAGATQIGRFWNAAYRNDRYARPGLPAGCWVSLHRLAGPPPLLLNRRAGVGPRMVLACQSRRPAVLAASTTGSCLTGKLTELAM